MPPRWSQTSSMLLELASGQASQLSPAHWVLVGALLAVSTQALMTGLWRCLSKRAKGNNASLNGGDALYGLDHGKLNIGLPPATMWMNMGLWRDVDQDDFTGACRALLYALLDQAGLLEPLVPDPSLRRFALGKAGIGHAQANRFFRYELEHVSILDVGFGCGDQTLCLADLASATNTVVQYLGITLNKTQFQYAQWRMPIPAETRHVISLFRGDASRPDTWTEPCLAKASAMADLRSQDTTGYDRQPPRKAAILLALDTLYHFSPSRLPILTYGAKELGADLVAFDILLSDRATLLQTLRLRVLGKLSGCPWNAFVTEREYREMLVRAGYKADSIVMQDITDHVFGPLHQYMGRQQVLLESIGLKMGSLRVAGWLFGWWARSQVVRGVIVTAKA